MKTDCQECGGTGGIDSGGFTPWQSPIMIPCPSCSMDAELATIKADRDELRAALVHMEIEADSLLRDLVGDSAALQRFRTALARSRAVLAKTEPKP